MGHWKLFIGKYFTYEHEEFCGPLGAIVFTANINDCLRPAPVGILPVLCESWPTSTLWDQGQLQKQLIPSYLELYKSEVSPICVFFFLSFFFFFSLSILVIKMYWLEKLSICVSKIHNDSEVSIIRTSSREFWFENTDFNKLWSRELRKRQKWRTQWACASEVLILCTLPEGRVKGDPTEGLPDHHSQEWYSATGPYWNHKWHTITTPRLPWAF